MADPETIVATARPGAGVVGWHLSPADRQRLLELFNPRYPQTIADHVTLAARVSKDTPLPNAVRAEVVGTADDGQGVEALVVTIDGSTDRPDGSTYHMTWSLKPGRHAKESNDVLREKGWTALERAEQIELIPARLR